MRLSEDVIRYLTIKQDGPMPAPRAIPGTTSEAAPMTPAASTEEVTAAV
jgi:small subunit ribosomal protein S6